MPDMKNVWFEMATYKKHTDDRFLNERVTFRVMDKSWKAVNRHAEIGMDSLLWGSVRTPIDIRVYEQVRSPVFAIRVWDDIMRSAQSNVVGA